MESACDTLAILTFIVGLLAATWFELRGDHNTAVFCLLVVIACAVLDRRKPQ